MLMDQVNILVHFLSVYLSVALFLSGGAQPHTNMHIIRLSISHSSLRFYQQ